MIRALVNNWKGFLHFAHKNRFEEESMDIKPALVGQYRAGLTMMRAAIELCPEDLWLSGEHPRNFWRIAYHGLFYTHLYLARDEASFVAWEKHRPQARILWDDDEDGLPPIETPYTRAELLDYTAMLQAQVETMVNNLDLEAPDCGIPWYSMPKLDHQLLNVRHLQHHVGQLSELLLAQGIDIGWK